VTAALRIDLETAEVWAHGRPVQLTAKEYRAFSLLYERNGTVTTKEALAAHIWPEHQGIVDDSSIENIISRLRRKLEHEPENPQLVLTIRGLGYRLKRSP
jgi:two-component system, OmpR family, response regulator VicR